MPAYRADIPPHVAQVIRHLPPELKQHVKAAIRSLCANPEAGDPLIKELEGLWKYRVRRFRIVYAVNRTDRAVRILAIGHRKRIYDDLVDSLKTRKKEDSK